MIKYGSIHLKVIILTLLAVTAGSFIVINLKSKDIARTESGFAQTDSCGISSNIASVNGPSGYSFSLSCAISGALQYHNESRFSFFQLSPPYSSLLYVKTPNSEVKDLSNLAWNINVTRPSQLYLFFRRIPGIPPTVPAWASSYQRITPDGYSELNRYLLRKNEENSLIGLYDIWQSNSSDITGRVNFGPASNDVVNAPAYSMYIVGIKPQSQNVSPPSSPVATSTSSGGTLQTAGVIYNADSSANISRSRQTLVKVPANLISPTQGWIAGRIKFGFNASTGLSPDPVIFDMSESDPRDHFIYFDVDSHGFHFSRNNGAGGNILGGPAKNFTAGTTLTIIATWNATTTYISAGGDNFTSRANASIPVQSPLYIGSTAVQGSKRQPDSDYYWVAAGTGLLTNNDVATINGFGNTDRARSEFPGSVTFMWDAASDRYNTR